MKNLLINVVINVKIYFLDYYLNILTKVKLFYIFLNNFNI